MAISFLGESVLCPPVSPDMMSPMKKLLAIVVLGLLLSGNAYANKEKANSHGGAHELPESARPNDATISLFKDDCTQ